MSDALFGLPGFSESLPTAGLPVSQPAIDPLKLMTSGSVTGLDLSQPTPTTAGLQADLEQVLGQYRSDRRRLVGNEASAIDPLTGTKTELDFTAGVFTARESTLTAEYLWDGGGYGNSQVGVFLLDGMESLTGDAFHREAAKRATSNSTSGYVLVDDRTEGAKLSGKLSFEDNFNQGPHGGVKSFAVKPGAKYGLVLIPDGSLADIAAGGFTGASRRPLYSMATTNPNGLFQAGQLVEAGANATRGNTYIFEDLRLDQGSDRDYNDVVIRLRGVNGYVPSINDYINPNKDWRKEEPSKLLINEAVPYVTVELPPATPTPTTSSATDPVTGMVTPGTTNGSSTGTLPANMGAIAQPATQPVTSPLGTFPSSYPTPEDVAAAAAAVIPANKFPIVGVIDTGFARSNPDLDYSKIVWGKDYIDNDADPLLNPGEGNEHGTHLLGLISALRNNGVGIDGLAPDAPIWAARAVGSGNWAKALVDYVDYIKTKGQTRGLVNLSFDLTQKNADGTISTRYEFTPEERVAIETARQAGVVLVVAAGNSGTGDMSVLAQAAQEFDNIISVAAAEQIDRSVAIADGAAKTDYSSSGKKLTLSAIGGAIEQGIPSLLEEGLGTMAGTSVATAKVTANAALAWAANPSLNYLQLKDVLTKTATDIEAPGYDELTGYGIVNGAAAVSLAQITQGEPYKPEPWFAPDSWGGEGLVTAWERPVATGSLVGTTTIQPSWSSLPVIYSRNWTSGSVRLLDPPQYGPTVGLPSTSGAYQYSTRSAAGVLTHYYANGYLQQQPSGRISYWYQPPVITQQPSTSPSSTPTAIQSSTSLIRLTPASLLFSAMNVSVGSGAPTSLNRYSGLKQGNLNSSNPDDLFSFDVTKPGEYVQWSAKTLSGKLRMQIIRDANNNGLLDSGETVYNGSLGLNSNQSMTFDEKGRYYVRLFPGSGGVANYQLTAIGSPYRPLHHGADFNRDGSTDLVRQEKGASSYDNIRTAEVFTYGASGGSLISKFTDLPNDVGGSRVNLIWGDFNGDRRPDYIRQEKADWATWNDSNKDRNTELWLAGADGKSFYKERDLDAATGSGFNGNFVTLIPGDFDGDGRMDFIRQEKSDWDNNENYTAEVWMNAGAANFRMAHSLTFGGDGFKGDYVNLIPGDFDGDGRTDLIRQEKSSWDDDGSNTAVVFLSNGNGQFRQGAVLNNSANDLKGDFTNLIPGDFNGDGKTDFIRQEKNTWDDDEARTAEVWLSNGGMSQFTRVSTPLRHDGDDFKGGFVNIIPGDFNGDGRTDIIRQEFGPRSQSDEIRTAEVFLSSGDGTFSKYPQLIRYDGDDFKGTSTNILTGAPGGPAPFYEHTESGSDWVVEYHGWPSNRPKPVDLGWDRDDVLGSTRLGSNIRSDGKRGFQMDWGSDAPDARVPNDQFAMRAYTQYSFEAGKTYVARVRADDGYRLFAKHIGTNEWVNFMPDGFREDAYGAHKEIRFTVPKSGTYDFHFEFYDGALNAYFDLSLDEVQLAPNPGGGTSGSSGLPTSASEASAFFKYQFNPNATSVGNCGPASLAMIVEALGKEPPGLTEQGSINYASDLMNRARNAASSSSDQIEIGVNKIGSVAYVDGWDELDRQLAAGNPFIAYGDITNAWEDNFSPRMNSRAWQSASIDAPVAHIIAILGRTSSGNYVVGDPAYPNGPVEMNRSQLAEYFGRHGESPAGNGVVVVR